MADASAVRPEPPTERRGGYAANGAKVGELPKPPKEATVSPAADPAMTGETPAASQES